jgi:RNA-directed DNA polymerase
MDELKAPGKPFDISKRAVWEAWEKVKANKGAPRVDAVTVAEFSVISTRRDGSVLEVRAAA